MFYNNESTIITPMCSHTEFESLGK